MLSEKHGLNMFQQRLIRNDTNRGVSTDRLVEECTDISLIYENQVSAMLNYIWNICDWRDFDTWDPPHYPSWQTGLMRVKDLVSIVTAHWEDADKPSFTEEERQQLRVLLATAHPNRQFER